VDAAEVVVLVRFDLVVGAGSLEVFFAMVDLSNVLKGWRPRG
jgi:hypothetical protein